MSTGYFVDKIAGPGTDIYAAAQEKKEATAATKAKNLADAYHNIGAGDVKGYAAEAGISEEEARKYINAYNQDPYSMAGNSEIIGYFQKQETNKRYISALEAQQQREFDPERQRQIIAAYGELENPGEYEGMNVAKKDVYELLEDKAKKAVDYTVTQGFSYTPQQYDNRVKAITNNYKRAASKQFKAVVASIKAKKGR